MERDWEIVREILTVTESLEPNQYATLKDFDNTVAFVVSHNVKTICRPENERERDMSSRER